MKLSPTDDRAGTHDRYTELWLSPLSGENLPYERALSLPANPSALFQPLYPTTRNFLFC